MRKFTYGYMLFLALFVVIGGAMIIFSKNNDTPQEITESQYEKTPGLKTMVQLKEILEREQLDTSLKNIEVNPVNTKESVIIELQGNDYVTEDILLKDSYNIMSSAASIANLNDLTIIWFSNVIPNNEEALTITVTQNQLEQMKTIKYSEIPSIAKTYTKNDNLK